MTRLARILTALAALLMLGAFVWPLWLVRLTAPQYPEGIGLDIRIATIAGQKEFDLANVNALNHYIGMKAIEPDAIPELKVMPWIVAALAAVALLAAASGRRRLLAGWLVGFLVLGLAGLADFWWWEYDYGHNLSPDAIITIPGMSYQPPLIGSKQLANFTASSWPGPGGVALGLAFLTGAAALLLSRRAARAARAARPALVAVALLAAALPAGALPAGAQTIVVSPDGPLRSVGEAVRRARPGARIVVRQGVYREPTIVVDRPLVLVGEGEAVLDGEGERPLLLVTADDVSVRGLTFRNVAPHQMQDRAAVRVQGAAGCAIEGNRFENTYFGIYLAQVAGCRVAGNVLRATPASEVDAGNGIHLWSSRDVVVADNRIAGHRDGIYLEFARAAEIARNTSEGNVRYGLHFMYSDSCRYVGNVFRANAGGVAVMYTKVVAMTENTFADSRGGAAYGLFLKEVADARLTGNRFDGNTVGLVADGASRLVAERNEFARNGWAVKLMASTDDARFEGNDFLGNTFDVATNSRGTSTTFLRNFFDDYRGYDLDRDGLGDVPHRPARLFSLLVAENAPTLILLRSFFVTLLDAAERALPALTPETLVDSRPAMRANRESRIADRGTSTTSARARGTGRGATIRDTRHAASPHDHHHSPR